MGLDPSPPPLVSGHGADMYNTLQHTAARRNTQQHTLFVYQITALTGITDCNRLQQTATDCNTHSVYHIMALTCITQHCNTLQHAATHTLCVSCHSTDMYNTLQHTAARRNTQQHTLSMYHVCAPNKSPSSFSFSLHGMNLFFFLAFFLRLQDGSRSVCVTRDTKTIPKRTKKTRKKGFYP